MSSRPFAPGGVQGSPPLKVEALAQPALGVSAARTILTPRPQRTTPWRVVPQMWARAGWLALRHYRNPIRAARALARVRASTRTRNWAAPTGAHLQRSRWPRFVTVGGRYFWSLHTPGWPSAAFDGFVRHELDRAMTPGPPATLNTAIVAMTTRCALKCEHCFEWDALNHPEPLSSDDLHDIVGRLRARGVSQIFFSGGEPLQRFGDLVSLTEAISADTDVWVLTSGVGLTRERAQRLRAAGLIGLSLSLDHWDEAAHDRFRGLPGASAGAARAAVHARDAGLVVAVSLCPTRAFVTTANLDRYADRARELGATFIQILEPKAIGHYAGQDVTLAPGQQRLLETFCARLNTDPAARHLPTVSYPDWSTRALGCVGAGDRYVYVDTIGDLHGCPFCRTPGIRTLDHDMNTALSLLQAAGCPAAACACDSTACSAPV